MALRTLVASALIALNLGLVYQTILHSRASTAAAPAPAAPSAPTPIPAPVYILRVKGAALLDAAVIAANYDLLEMREGDDLFVQGDDRVADSLRARGYAVTVHHTLPALSGSDERLGVATYYGGYRTVAEHYAHLDEVAAAHPELVKLHDYGDSWRKLNSVPNGHDLRAICITKQRDGDCALDPDTDKPRFLLIASMHARELTPAEVAWRWIDYLVDGYGSNADVTWLLDHNEMWVIPLANPDGRFIVQQGGNDPYLHRKNTNTVDGPCSTSPLSSSYGGNHPGIDLNRNGSWKWELRVTASDVACSAVFRGPSAASEPENYFLETLARQLFHDQRGPALTDAAPFTTTGTFITLHSFADQVILPWNYTTAFNAPNDAGLRALAFRMSHYNGYRTGQSGEILYSTSGSTDDFTYGELGLPSYTYEIGPGSGGCAGFTPPYSCLSGFWSENLGALLYAAKASRQPYATSFGPTPISVSTTPAVTGTRVSVTFNDNALGNNGVARPSAQLVTGAELYLDAPPWAGGAPMTMTLADGAANSSTEAFVATVQLPACDNARHQVFMRGIDANGNFGVLASAFITSAAAVLPDVCALSIAPGIATTDTQVTISATVSTTLPLSITAAQLQIDTDDFVTDVITMTAIDGAADGPVEVFTATIDAGLLPLGVHTATVRGITSDTAFTPTKAATFLVFPLDYPRVWVPMVMQ
jgi:carboxypeptidase T